MPQDHGRGGVGARAVQGRHVPAGRGVPGQRARLRRVRQRAAPAGRGVARLLLLPGLPRAGRGRGGRRAERRLLARRAGQDPPAAPGGRRRRAVQGPRRLPPTDVPNGGGARRLPRLLAHPGARGARLLGVLRLLRVDDARGRAGAHLAAAAGRRPGGHLLLGAHLPRGRGEEPRAGGRPPRRPPLPRRAALPERQHGRRGARLSVPRPQLHHPQGLPDQRGHLRGRGVDHAAAAGRRGRGPGRGAGRRHGPRRRAGRVSPPASCPAGLDCPALPPGVLRAMTGEGRGGVARRRRAVERKGGRAGPTQAQVAPPCCAQFLLGTVLLGSNPTGCVVRDVSGSHPGLACYRTVLFQQLRSIAAFQTYSDLEIFIFSVQFMRCFLVPDSFSSSSNKFIFGLEMTSPPLSSLGTCRIYSLPLFK
ncbi:hypothetical protein FOCC_FOCC014500 [Frankliniella occidentalis]|nr:hypothetical protein FOCC_FOCC014500 [Frankliniella occidentalis]